MMFQKVTHVDLVWKPRSSTWENLGQTNRPSSHNVLVKFVGMRWMWVVRTGLFGKPWVNPKFSSEHLLADTMIMMIDDENFRLMMLMTPLGECSYRVRRKSFCIPKGTAARLSHLAIILRSPAQARGQPIYSNSRRTAFSSCIEFMFCRWSVFT